MLVGIPVFQGHFKKSCCCACSCIFLQLFFCTQASEECCAAASYINCLFLKPPFLTCTLPSHSAWPRLTGGGRDYWHFTSAPILGAFRHFLEKVFCLYRVTKKVWYKCSNYEIYNEIDKGQEIWNCHRNSWYQDVHEIYEIKKFMKSMKSMNSRNPWSHEIYEIKKIIISNNP